jgi:hypothetical protein
MMTPAERKIWSAISELREFSFSEALAEAKTTNRKPVASTLRKAESARLIEHGLDKVYRHGTKKRN